MTSIRKVLLSTALILFCSIYMYGQHKEYAVELKSERVRVTGQESLNINATLNKPGSYSVLIWFLEQHNTNQYGTLLKVVKGSGSILKVTPNDPKKPFTCRYRYSYASGYKPRKLDTTFVYRLPYSTHRAEPVRVSYLYNFNQRYANRDNTDNWQAFNFHLAKGDTIVAVRKGVVVEIKDEFDPMEREEHVSFTTKTNSIKIEHPDGTICRYDIFEKGSFMVSEGDVVYPGTPLGLCGKQNKAKEDYQLKLGIYYPVLNPNLDIDDPKSPRFIMAYCNPIFATDQGNTKLIRKEKYRAVSSNELVQKEMTKKEIKKMGR